MEVGVGDLEVETISVGTGVAVCVEGLFAAAGAFAFGG
jgi:hypothetical protein